MGAKEAVAVLMRAGYSKQQAVDELRSMVKRMRDSYG